MGNNRQHQQYYTTLEIIDQSANSHFSLMKQPITTIAAVLLAECGKSATDTAKPVCNQPMKKKEKHLAAFLSGKRIYLKMPTSKEPSPCLFI
jgi:hypothetical protein